MPNFGGINTVLLVVYKRKLQFYRVLTIPIAKWLFVTLELQGFQWHLSHKILTFKSPEKQTNKQWKKHQKCQILDVKERKPYQIIN